MYSPYARLTDDAALIQTLFAVVALQCAILLPPLLFGLTRERSKLISILCRSTGMLNCMCLVVFLGRNSTVTKTDAALAVLTSTVHMFVLQSAEFFQHPRLLSYAAVCAWVSLASSLYFPVAMMHAIGSDQPTALHTIAIFVSGEVFEIVASLSARVTKALGDTYAALMA